MNIKDSLRNQFLVAMPSLVAPHFFQSVALMCEHNDQGAMGIVINHPLEVTLRELLEHMQIETTRPELSHMRVFSGGPVQQERGFVLHQPEGKWQSTVALSKEVAITTSRDILEAMAVGHGPTRALVALGYAGWEGGQLEQEVLENTWLTTPSATNIIFDTDVDNLSSAAGHA
jgi:putative transcriptional regulator